MDEVAVAPHLAAGRRPVAHVEAPAGRRVPAARRHDGPGRAHTCSSAVARRRCSIPAAATCACSWRGRRCAPFASMPLPSGGAGRREPARAAVVAEHERGVPPLTLANGIGGFADEGRTYAIVLEGDQETPAPWANVHLEPALRHRPQRQRIGDHVVREQPREPADAVRQRSGRRSRRRSDLRSRRRYRPRVVADAGPDGRATPASGRFLIRHSGRRCRASRDRSRACITSSRCSSTTPTRCGSRS